MSTETQKQAGGEVDGAGTQNSLTVTDNRTGETYELPVTDGTVRAMDLRSIKVSDDDFGLMAYDPAFTNTASTRSEITYIDGAAGILEYRGYSIEQLCEDSNYLEVAYLLIHGELPTQKQFDAWDHEITIHTFVHENVKSFMQGFRYDAHPMGMLLASTGALSTFYPDANRIKDEEIRYLQIIRLLAKMPTLAAFAFRHNMGQPYVYPDNDLSYAGNFLSMMYKMTELSTSPTRGWSARSTSSSSSTPTTSRTAPRRPCGRSAPPRSTRTRRSRPASARSTARCTAAPTSKRCGCLSASARSRTSPTSSPA